jgi:hypothetical protein
MLIKTSGLSYKISNASLAMTIRKGLFLHAFSPLVYIQYLYRVLHLAGILP